MYLKTERGFGLIGFLISSIIFVLVTATGVYIVLNTDLSTGENDNVATEKKVELSPNQEKVGEEISAQESASKQSSSPQTKETVESIQTPITEPTPTTLPLEEKIDSCREIKLSGDYVLTNNIVNTKSEPCINFQSVNNVSLDCKDYTITSKNEDYNIYLKKVTNFVVSNCILVTSVNLPSDRVQHVLRIEDAHEGELYNNIVGGNFVSISGSSAITISKSIFTNQLSIYKSNNITIKNNDFSNNIDPIILQEGHNNMVISNVIDGKSDGIFHNDGDNIGADDGIVIKNESNDTIQGNIIENVWDCGIENDGYIFDSKIIGNTVKNAGVCLFGGWFSSSVKGNLIKDNVGDNIPRLFVFFRLYGLEGAEKIVYFKDNTFENNKFINPRKVEAKGGGMDFREASSITIEDNAVPASSIVVGNNIFTNNDFTTIAKPIKFAPFNMIVDGGGNICPTIEVSDYPLKCN